MHFHFYHLFFTLTLILSGCTQSNEKDFESKNIKIQSSIIIQLQEIHSLNEAKIRFSKLEDLFIELSELIISVDKKQVILSSHSSESSKKMQEELDRLIVIPGVEELIKKAQEKGFRKIEKYLHTKEKSV